MKTLRLIFATLMVLIGGATLNAYASKFLEIDTETMKSQNSRSRGESKIEFCIFHCIGLENDFIQTHYVLPKGEKESLGVSCHWYVSQESQKIFQLVDENLSAFHAGPSDWSGRKGTLLGLNDCSIGIEFQCPGFGKIGEKTYYPFSFQNFDDNVIRKGIDLSIDIINRHQIYAEYVLPHSSIAPGRKTDPGSFFPFEEFAKNGVGIWAKKDRVLDSQLDTSLKHTQNLLKKLGYPCDMSPGFFDPSTQQNLQAHCLHHTPTVINWEDHKEKPENTTIFHGVQWENMDMNAKQDIVINLENLVAGEYMYKPLHNLKYKEN